MVIWHQFLSHIGFSMPVPAPELYDGYPVFLQKPIHVLLLTLSSFAFGLHVWVVFAHSILYGVATVAMTLWLGRRMFGDIAGVVAGLWVCLEPYHVHYSRLGLHETDSMFLFLAGTALWYASIHHDRKILLFGSGVILMCAMGSSYRLLPMCLMIGAFELARSLRTQPFLSTIRRTGWMAGGAAMAFLWIDVAYRLAFNPDYLWSETGSYIQLLKKKFISSESSFDLMAPDFYLTMFHQFDGWIPLIILFTAVCWTLVRGGLERWLTGSLFLVPFIILSLTTTRLARAQSIILPWGALAVGVLFQDWIRSEMITCKARKLKFAIGLGILIIVSMAAKWIPIYQLTSGYPAVIEFLKKQDASFHLSTMKPVYASYLGRHAVADPGKTLEELQEQVRQTGVRYLSVDWQKYLRYPDSIAKIEEKILPVFAAPNPVGDFFASLYENHLPWDVPKLRDRDPTLHYIKVYDLHTALPELGYPLNQDAYDHQEK